MMDRGPRRPFDAIGTASPAARLWALTPALAAVDYARAFRPQPGAVVLVRGIDDPKEVGAFAVTRLGLRAVGPK